MKVHIVEEYCRIMESSFVIKVFDSREKAIDYISSKDRENRENFEYDLVYTIEELDVE